MQIKRLFILFLPCILNAYSQETRFYLIEEQKEQPLFFKNKVSDYDLFVCPYKFGKTDPSSEKLFERYIVDQKGKKG